MAYLPQHPRIVSLEGNIGSGKSTLLHEMQREFGSDTRVVFVREPVDIWEKICDPNTLDAKGLPVSLLTKFYADPVKYAFAFQVMAFSSRLRLLRQAVRDHPGAELIICERSIEADNHVFADMLFRDGTIEPMLYSIYLHFYQEFITDNSLHKCIYLTTSPEVCHERIALRARNGENDISLAYLQACDFQHRRWLLEPLASSPDGSSPDICSSPELLTLDANHNINNNPALVDEWMESIRQFLWSK